MGKGARLRAQRKAEYTADEPKLIQRPRAVRVTPPRVAKEQRTKRAAAFRKWRTLPKAERIARTEAAMKKNEETTTDD